MATQESFVNAVERKWLTSASARAAYTYIPKTSKIPALYITERIDDPIVHIKLFDPCGSWTWFLTEADRATGRAFGLVHGHEVELGYIDLHELSALRTGPFGLPIERDIHFTPKPLSEIRKRLEAA